MKPIRKHVEIGETVLVALAQSRDLTAFDELVGLYQGRLTYFVRRLIRDTQETEDVIQEVWIIVHRRLGTLQSPQAFRVWLFKIAHDVAVSHLRSVTRVPTPMSKEIEQSDAIDAWDEFEAMVNADIVHRTLEALSHEHREVLTLRFLEQMDLNEIAEVVGCSTGTVKSRLHYAKAALRHQIEGKNNG
jgi:RNA polymerase sigma-70 factor, ECF subfamily